MTFLEKVKAASRDNNNPDHERASAYLRRRDARVAQRSAMGIGQKFCAAFRKEGDTLILDMLTPSTPPMRGGFS